MRRPRQLLSAVVLMLCLSTGLSPAYAQGTPAIFTGRVEAKESKEPVPNAVIRLFRLGSEKSYETKTDKKGNFVKSGISPGRYRVVVECSGYHNLEIQSQEFMNNQTLKVTLPLPRL